MFSRDSNGSATERQWCPVAQQRLAENITLLKVLNSEPERPIERELPDSKETNDDSAERCLTLKQERDLVDVLASVLPTTNPFDWRFQSVA
jgi:hypothetical protein